MSMININKSARLYCVNTDSWPLTKLIDLAAPLHFTAGPIPQPLIDSVKKIGVVNLPILYQRGADYFLIHGRRRIEILHSINPSQNISVKIYDSSKIDLRQAFDLNLFENVAARILNPIEKSNALHILKSLVSDEIIQNDYLPCLSLPPTPESLHQYLKLQILSDPAKGAVIQGKMQVDSALFLLEFPNEDRDFLLSIILQLGLGMNTQKQWLRLAWDISKKAGHPFTQAFPTENIHHILSSNLAPNQKWARMEEALKHRRYPILSQLDDQYQLIKRDLKIPPEISLQAPAYFEKEEYSLQFRFKSEEEFKARISLLNELPSKKSFKDLFQLTREHE